MRPEHVREADACLEIVIRGAAGAGKSVAAGLVAAALADKGYRVFSIDCDGNPGPDGETGCACDEAVAVVVRQELSGSRNSVADEADDRREYAAHLRERARRSEDLARLLGAFAKADAKTRAGKGKARP
jgi:CO dehydrogenase nickel-insertion accessory protein CooC1